MCLVALLKTRLSHFTDYSFTVFTWMKDGGRRRRQLRMIKNLNRNLCVKKMSIRQEYTINCSYCQICLELQFMLFLLYFLHVMFSNHIQLILFLFSGGEEEDQGGEVRQRPKSPASDCIREKKVCNIYSIFS